nr:hypothetical protein [Pseudomonas putida]
MRNQAHRQRLERAQRIVQAANRLTDDFNALDLTGQGRQLNPPRIKTATSPANRGGS